MNQSTAIAQRQRQGYIVSSAAGDGRSFGAGLMVAPDEIDGKDLDIAKVSGNDHPAALKFTGRPLTW